MIHKAFVDVNEEGTEAAAATAVVTRAAAARVEPPTPVFRADHPFVFLIRDARPLAAFFSWAGWPIPLNERLDEARR